MFTNNVLSYRNILQQVKWKFAVYPYTIVGLLILQILMVFTLSEYRSNLLINIGAFEVRISPFNLSAFSIVTAVFIFFVSLLVGTKSSMIGNFIIPTTRTLANVSNSLYLLSLSLITAMLCFASLYMTVALNVLLEDAVTLKYVTNLFSFGHFIGLTCFLWCVSSVAYLLISLFNIRIWLGTLVVVLFAIILRTEFQLLQPIIQFFMQGGIWLVSLKCFVTSFVFYFIAFLITYQLEVK